MSVICWQLIDGKLHSLRLDVVKVSLSTESRSHFHFLGIYAEDWGGHVHHFTFVSHQLLQLCEWH